MERIAPWAMSRSGALGAEATWLLLAFACGGLIGFIAWTPGGTTWALLLLAVAWSAVAHRHLSFALMWGYYAIGARDVPIVTARFFPQLSLELGVLIWSAHAAVLASVWYFLWPRRDRAATAVFGHLVAIILILALPPIGSVGWISPFLVAGDLFPGWGYIGACLGVATLAQIAVVARYRTLRTWAILATCFALSAIAHLNDSPKALPAGWIAIDTHLGAFPVRPSDAFLRHQELIALAKKSLRAGAKLVVLPEEIAGPWRPAARFWWTEVDQAAKAEGATVLLGTDIFSGEAYRDSVVFLGADDGVIASRQPIPIGLWRPWSDAGAIADWMQSGVAPVRGKRVAFSVCYEDFLLWPVFVAAWSRPEVIISVANNWFGEGLDVPFIQQRSIELTARLLGLPLIRAVNYWEPSLLPTSGGAALNR